MAVVSCHFSFSCSTPPCHLLFYEKGSCLCCFQFMQNFKSLYQCLTKWLGGLLKTMSANTICLLTLPRDLYLSCKSSTPLLISRGRSIVQYIHQLTQAKFKLLYSPSYLSNTDNLAQQSSSLDTIPQIKWGCDAGLPFE